MNNAQANETTMNRYFDPTNDVAFKKVFGTEEAKPRLRSFLNALLRRKEGEYIVDLHFLPQEECPMIDGGRRVIFDVKCRDQQGHEFIVEMQNRNVPEFFKRSQYYVSHCYVSQIGKGRSYFELRPVVLIAIANFELFTDDDDPISYHRTLNTKTYKNHLLDLAYVFVDLTKFNKQAADLKTVEDQWLYLLKEAADLKEVPKSVIQQEVIDAFTTLEQFNWNVDEYDAYVCANIAATDDCLIQAAKFEEGKKEGREEGEKKGEKKASLTIAQKLLSQGLSESQISDATGLSLKDIRSLN